MVLRVLPRPETMSEMGSGTGASVDWTDDGESRSPRQFFEKRREVLLKVTDSCEMNCQACGQRSQDRNDTRLNVEDIARLASECLTPGQRVYVWGGEPLRHPGIEEAVRLLKNAGAVVALNTNGWTLTDHLETLVALELDRLIVSIDGATPTTHDFLRGKKGSHERIVEAISRLNALRTPGSLPRLRLNYVVLPQNYREIPQFLSWARTIQAHSVSLQLPMFLTRMQLQAYEETLRRHHGIRVRRYDAFVQEHSGIDYRWLSAVMNEVSQADQRKARFVPFPNLSAGDLRTYFTGGQTVCHGSCDVMTGKVAVDTSGALVTCPDFPDLAYGSLEGGIDDLGRRRWLEERNTRGAPLPICSRCCHFKPQ